MQYIHEYIVQSIRVYSRIMQYIHVFVYIYYIYTPHVSRQTSSGLGVE